MAKMPVLSVPLLLLWSVALAAPLSAADATVDGEGFIRDWLMLAPFAIEENSGAADIDKMQIAKEGELRPKAGDKHKIGDKEEAWKAVRAKDYHLDFNATLGKAHEDVLGYLVTYVVAEKEMPGLTLSVSSNDQSRLWLNGKEVYRYIETRAIDRDQDKVANVTLAKGVNVIVFKVINEKNDWAAALRFFDKGEKPVTGLVVRTAP